jgi:hypothetical protein
MASTKSGFLSNTEILTKLAQKSQEAVGWYDSRISKERMRVVEYYNAQLPRRQHLGSSTYISTDVYDSVEMMKAQLLEVFAGGDEIARFDPDSDMAVETCREATEACRYVIFRENDGFRIFNDVIHDGLTARVGVAKVFWDETYEHVEDEFHGLSHQDAMALASQDHVEEFEADLNELDGTYKGTLVRKADKSKVKIEVVAPEEFLIEPRAISLHRAGYCGHRTLKTKQQLKDMGLDAKKVDRTHYDDNRGLDLSPEVLARNAPVETLQSLNNPIEPGVEQVMLYESYVRMTIDRKKGIRLYKILHTSSDLFDYQEVDRIPFIVYVPLPVPHLFYGNNYAARVIPYQNARTVLTRSVLDHASMTTNPRWAVVKGGLINPREMVDNRLGGLVNVSRPDSVTALQVPNLNPFVFELLQNLGEGKEQSTGISSLSQGLNKDAISKQNSAGLVDNLVQLSGQRQKIAARQFAYGFFAPLMVEVMRLLCLNEKRQKMIDVCGQWKQVQPSYWTERTTCTISMHLGYGEKEQHLSKLQGLYKEMSADPALQNMFDQEGRFNLINDAAKVANLTNISSYLKAPDKAKPIQPDPLKVQELQIKDKQAQAQLLAAQAQMARDQRLAQIDSAKLQQGNQKLALESLDHDRTHNRQDLETAARINVANREMRLEEEMRPEELDAKLSPHP